MRKIPLLKLGGFGSIVIILLLILEYEGVINYISLTLPVPFNQFSQFISGIGTLILTFVLVVLYQQQTTIQSRQENWMRASHRPDISIYSWQIEENEVKLLITNLGNGVARNLYLSITITPILLSKPFPRGEPISGEGALFRDDLHVRSVEDGSKEPIKFETRPIPVFMAISKKSDSNKRFHDVIMDLFEREIEEYALKVSLNFEYIEGEPEIVTLWSSEVPVMEDQTLASAINNSKRINWEEMDVNQEPDLIENTEDTSRP